jgi:hypothetical protein
VLHGAWLHHARCNTDGIIHEFIIYIIYPRNAKNWLHQYSYIYVCGGHARNLGPCINIQTALCYRLSTPRTSNPIPVDECRHGLDSPYSNT